MGCGEKIGEIENERKNIWSLKSKHFPRLIRDAGYKKPYATPEGFMDKQKTSHQVQNIKFLRKTKRKYKKWSKFIYIYIYS